MNCMKYKGGYNMAIRKTTILGQKRVSYSKAILEITGWSKKEFETQKRLMRYRVSKFNAFTGSNLSPIEQLFYKVRYEARKAYYEAKGKPVLPLNDLQQAFQDMKATAFTRKTNLVMQNGKFVPAQMSKADLQAFNVAKDFIIKRFEGLANAFPEANAIMQDLKNGVITPAEANKQLSDLAEKMRNVKNEDLSTWFDLHYDQENGST